MSNDSILVPVSVGACLCPGTPHADGDYVYLRPKLGLASGIALQKMVLDAASGRPDAADLMGKLAEAYLIHGVADWNLVDETGRAIAVSPVAIQVHLLSDFVRAEPVAEAADDLYMGPVIAPLLKRAQRSSVGTPTNGSTLAMPNGSAKRPKPRKPSSTTTIPTGGTGKTSPALAGASSS